MTLHLTFYVNQLNHVRHISSKKKKPSNIFPCWEKVKENANTLNGFVVPPKPVDSYLFRKNLVFNLFPAVASFICGDIDLTF